MMIELNSLTDWFAANKLSLNVSKTNYMLFTNQDTNHIQLPNVVLSGQQIVETSSAKFLGIYIDNKLKWDIHINHIKRKLSSSAFAINKAKHILSRKYLTILYYSMVYPYRSYGITLWGSTYDVYINLLKVQQKWVIRSITGADFQAHSEPLFKSLQLLQLTDIYQLQVLKFTYAFVKNNLPHPFKNIFQLSQETHNHNTRSSTKYGT